MINALPGNATALHSARASQHSLRILVLEDHPDTRALMLRLLQSWGFEVMTACSLREAFGLLDGDPFDVLVADIGLPDGTGLDLMRRIKSMGLATSGIAITGYDIDHDAKSTRAAGFDVHLTKPIDPSMLQATIERLGERIT